MKLLVAKETDPSLLYVRELRGRGVNEESHMLPITQPSPGLSCVHGATQNPKAPNKCIPLPMSQSTPASIISISTQSNSDLDSHHGDMIDETIKQVLHTINQTLLTSNINNTRKNEVPNVPPMTIH